MDVTIRAGSEPDAALSAELNVLVDMLTKELDRDVDTEKRASSPGTKDGGLTIGIAIAGLVSSMISTTIAVINLWRSRRPGYTVNITYMSQSRTIEEFDEIIKSIEDTVMDDGSGLEVIVSPAAKATDDNL